MAEDRYDWERRKGEPESGFAIFSIYLRQDRPSIPEAYREYLRDQGKRPKAPSGHVNKMAKRWQWVERRAAYRERLASERTRTMRLASLRRASEIGDRLGGVRADLLDLAQRMIARCNDMLNHPLTEVQQRTEERNENGQVIAVNHITIKPAKWTMGSAASLSNASLSVVDFCEQLSGREGGADEARQSNEDVIRRVEQLIAEASTVETVQ